MRIKSFKIFEAESEKLYRVISRNDLIGLKSSKNINNIADISKVYDRVLDQMPPKLKKNYNPRILISDIGCMFIGNKYSGNFLLIRAYTDEYFVVYEYKEKTITSTEYFIDGYDGLKQFFDDYDQVGMVNYNEHKIFDERLYKLVNSGLASITNEKDLNLIDIRRISDRVMEQIPERYRERYKPEFKVMFGITDNGKKAYRLELVNINVSTVICVIWAYTDEYFFVSYRTHYDYFVDGYDGLKQLFEDINLQY